MKKQILIATVAASLVAAGYLFASPAHAASIETAFSPDGGAERLVLNSIDQAHSSIRVMAYSFTSRTVTAALIAARRRGVDVAVAVDYRNNLEEDRSGRARAALNALVYAGIPVKTVSVFDLQHSKYVVIDDVTVETGSFNYSAHARYNSENVVVIHDAPDTARAFAGNWQSVSAQGVAYRAP